MDWIFRGLGSVVQSVPVQCSAVGAGGRTSVKCLCEWSSLNVFHRASFSAEVWELVNDLTYHAKHNMWKILTIVIATWALAESNLYDHNKRDIATSLCDPLSDSNNKIRCYCKKYSSHSEQVKVAECSLTTKNVEMNDPSWDEFVVIENVTKLTLTNTKGISLSYIPTDAIQYTKALTKLIITYGNIEDIPPFAFANLTQLEEIIVRDSNIKTLQKYAFAHHKATHTISLDNNGIEEINRDVFVDLPSLKQLYLTSNKIAIIHDRAFTHLNNLKELEIDKNELFSLNSETFHGLRKLDRLVLSNNNLEVIGAKTFVHLVQLQSLSLDGNHIQMLDEKAFNGATQLTSLTLARNKLKDFDNAQIFEGLNNLRSLSLRDNQLVKIKAESMTPIINNLHTVGSFFDFEGNKFPCDCNLDWFLTLINKTRSTVLKTSIENFKCYPSDALRETWMRVSEVAQNEELQESEPQNQHDYEYYDDSQLNGTLFYTDIRFLLNCSGNIVLPGPTYVTSDNKVVKEQSSPTSSYTTASTPVTSKAIIRNQGMLDLFPSETTIVPKTVTTTDSRTELNKVTERNEKKIIPTTSKLATVSAKPIDKNYDDHDMASDEAKPEKLNARRSYHEDIDNEQKSNNSPSNAGCVTLSSILLMLSLSSFL
ncbi:connectin-like [Plodia interpunctella]|uniref:connectin-like n=1 Tax=Plodia interpunctella TaxID=58824 RepID=UPI002367B5A9|nr:connectin-like [Plodia interpunctella]